MTKPKHPYIQSPYLWDYAIKKSDLKKPAVKKFWLARKINFCDWQGIKRRDLEKYLPELDIRPELKKLLTLFLQHGE